MSYRREIPRDLFNEAKLLKCLGQLSLILLDGDGFYPLKLHHRSPEKGFIIDQVFGSGDLFCKNLKLVLRGRGEVSIHSLANSREPYPLYFVADKDSDEQPVFNGNGTFSAEFLDFIGMVTV